jgi:hypothetical protein
MKKTNDKKDAVIPEGHSLKTRRDFLSYGLVGACTWVVAPDLLSVINSASAQATGCAQAINNSAIPVLIIDMAGGANIAGSNIMVGRSGGQLDFLDTYKYLGLPSAFHPNQSGMLNHEFGLAFHSDSFMLRGIQAHTNEADRSKTDGMIVCTSVSDDTSNNQINPAFWLADAGASGSLLNLVGAKGSGGSQGVGPNGGYSVSPVNSISKRSLAVEVAGVESLKTLVALNKIETSLSSSPDKVQKVLKTIQKLSESKLNSFSRRTLPQQIADVVKCGIVLPQEVVGGPVTPAHLDPMLDTAGQSNINAIFNLSSSDKDFSYISKNLVGTTRNGNTLAERKNQASVIKLLADGYVGVGTIVLGGGDYHDKTASKGNEFSLQVGRLIGRTISTFAKKGKPVMIHLITDGGVSFKDEVFDESVGGEGKYAWSSDAGDRSATVTLVYNPNGKVGLRTPDRRQLGSYINAVSCNNTTATICSNNPVNCAKVTVANYLALSGRETQLATIVGDNPFTRGSQNYEDYLFFESLV